ncbi:MAG: cytochrome c maturation protein CcmE [Acidiferrobacterales bacterium]|nr:cytochrome c maturation protein CcmE [Acidiferrobacterales bacterium]
MTPRRARRLGMAGLIVVGVSVTLALTLNTFQSNLLYFISPSEIAAGDAPVDREFRIGGIVVEGSVDRPGEDMLVTFDVTDTVETVPVRFSGILPDLFRDGQGIVAKGKLDTQGRFIAREVLAKHDENYMPPEVADALEAAKTLQTE